MTSWTRRPRPSWSCRRRTPVSDDAGAVVSSPDVSQCGHPTAFGVTERSGGEPFARPADRRPRGRHRCRIARYSTWVSLFNHCPLPRCDGCGQSSSWCLDTLGTRRFAGTYTGFRSHQSGVRLQYSRAGREYAAASERVRQREWVRPRKCDPSAPGLVAPQPCRGHHPAGGPGAASRRSPGVVGSATPGARGLDPVARHPGGPGPGQPAHRDQTDRRSTCPACSRRIGGRSG